MFPLFFLQSKGGLNFMSVCFTLMKIYPIVKSQFSGSLATGDYNDIRQEGATLFPSVIDGEDSYFFLCKWRIQFNNYVSLATQRIL